jgi:hypothetical protein
MEKVAGVVARNRVMVPLGLKWRGKNLPPLFFDRIFPKDLDLIRRQVKNRKFDESLVLGVAKRCSWGVPAVIVCAPLKALKPFPTSFWLTCPYITKACDRLESSGGVAQLESYLEQGKRREWSAFIMAHVALRMSLLDENKKRFLISKRPRMWDVIRKGGPGGILPKGKVTVKCLHLQVASWMALGWHPGELWLKERLPELKCPNCNQVNCFG